MSIVSYLSVSVPDMTTDKELLNVRETLCTPAEASQALRVTTKTLLRMAERGEIDSIILPSGHRRYVESSLEAILAREPWEPSQGQRDAG